MRVCFPAAIYTPRFLEASSVYSLRLFVYLLPFYTIISVQQLLTDNFSLVRKAGLGPVLEHLRSPD